MPSKSRIVIAAIVLASAGAAAGALAAPSNSVRKAAIRPARYALHRLAGAESPTTKAKPLTRTTLPPPSLGWRSVAEAQASLAGMSVETRSQLDLTPAVIATTQAVYTFSASSGSFAGLTVYGVDRGNAGSCYFLLGNGDCWAHAPAIGAPGQALPVQVSTSDFDGPKGLLPVVLFGHVAPEVTSVTLSCGAGSYSASLSGDTVTWVAPDASLKASDCTLNAAISNGGSFSERL